MRSSSRGTSIRGTSVRAPSTTVRAAPPKHAGAFEADSGTGAPLGFSWNTSDTLEGALAALAKLLEPLGAGTLRKGSAGGADISPMEPAGVPLFGLRQETGRYFDFHHTADDTFDKIEGSSLDKAAAAMAAMAYAVADLPEIHARSIASPGPAAR